MCLVCSVTYVPGCTSSARRRGCVFVVVSVDVVVIVDDLVSVDVDLDVDDPDLV